MTLPNWLKIFTHTWTDKCLCPRNKYEHRTVTIQKVKNTVVIMNYYLNKIHEYLWGCKEEEWKNVKRRLDLCETNIKHLTEDINSLFFSECEYNNEPVTDLDENHRDEDADSDGSNLGIFIKKRVNNCTNVNYITGKTDNYNLRKKLYNDMENIVDIKNESPKDKILYYNNRLREAGFEITHITDNNVFVSGDYENVKKLLQKTVQ
ncbi:38.7k [Matsumuraeses phaseoli granulovirus]|uniref:38.7k n=1 Tax=Matsumuraeses phaseoli granulovirus TaxID=2760664 RepID=A0AAE7MLE7_9BBAC|nr:38.7k [Matsumuraeses phaseoli granulovirus]QOD40026.1 38.7k [Matsumuraeses phaseoli granulovirus]